ncbi:hypothetical protein FDECE_11830 [Fusarium decemcellulare]|nr:hypothetical protein FDECE_11830 [Fusarium decemcellulare]
MLSPNATDESLGANQATNYFAVADIRDDPEGQLPTPSFLGGNSIISVTREGSLQPSTQRERCTAFETGIFPLLGMDMAAPQTTSSSTQQNQPRHPNSSLPDAREMIVLFNFYRHRVHPFQFVLDDIDEIERSLCSLINGDTEAQQYDAHFLCLLHAIFSLGAQFSDLAPTVRVPKYQNHLKHALGLLGTFDYLWNPSKRLIQAFLILGHVLQNDMNPRAAWILGGTTIRLGLSVGLHQPESIARSIRISPAEAQNLRLAIVWQDTLLSLAFDQPPASQMMDIGSDLPALAREGGSGVELTYRQGMNWICHLALRYLSAPSDTSSKQRYHEIFQAFDALERSIAPHLKSQTQCCSIQEIQEHHSLELHTNCVLSTLCRPILSRAVKRAVGEDESSEILERFQESLKRSVQALIRLRSISSHSTRSWAFVHNGLSSALLLSFIKGAKATEDTRKIQAKLIQSLTETHEDVGQLSIAHKKALKALQALQKLAEDDVANESATREEEGQESTNNQDEAIISQQNLVDPQDPSTFEMDDWLRTFEFDSFSPLDAYNFIMSDQVLPETGFQG